MGHARSSSIWYGNNTKTSYTYNALTYRLARLLTVNLATNDKLQDLNYCYDAVGNITRIRDDAQRTVFFSNSMVSADQDYTYDALYRLVIATGREQIGNSDFGSTDNYNPWMNGGAGMPFSSSALQNYTQNYSYDAVGNITRLQHRAASGSYTRDYNYTGNRLDSTNVGTSSGSPYNYSYDVYNNISQMPHVELFYYDWQNQLWYAQISGYDFQAFYDYSGGERIKKTVLKPGGIHEERIYLGSYELYRKYKSDGSLDVERSTVHVSDDTGRIAMYEALNTSYGSDGSPAVLGRYIYSNHLGSASLELNENGDIISYEEYHPYGTTAYQAMNSAISATAKRYRYTGKERDEETGLYYHGARYYIPWLARWAAVDRLEGKYSSQSSYNYGNSNPITWTDPTGMGGEKDTKEAPKMLDGSTANYTFTQNVFDYKGNLVSTNSTMQSDEINGLAHGEYVQDVRLPDSSRPVIRDGKLQVANVPTISNKFTPYGNASEQTSEGQKGEVLNRVKGGAKAIGGVLEMTGGAIGGAATAETVVGAALGWAAILHGSDVAAAGINQLLTGKEAESYTQKGIEAGLQTAGLDKNKSKQYSAYGDMALSMALGGVNPSTAVQTSEVAAESTVKG